MKTNKIWNKGPEAAFNKVDAFTIGKDAVFDLKLAIYDVKGTLAHVKMLAHVGLLTPKELRQIELELEHVSQLVQQVEFSLEDGYEDIHSFIENHLIHKLGEVGKKIHTARSRNDQVLTAIKLFLKQELLDISRLIEKLFSLFQIMSEENKQHLMPGYTHFQAAMPSSFGLWFGAYAEALVDDMEVLVTTYTICNKNPLGSAAGYGSSFPIDRQFTTDELGFAALNYNAVYAQMTRGKTEKQMANCLAAIAYTISRFCNDCCCFMNQQFGFISLPLDLTTGSSIMPHKQNPDVFELIRAKCNRIQALPNEFTLFLANLPLGYNRDMQLSKEMLFPALDEIKSCIEMLIFVLPQIKVGQNTLKDSIYDNIFTVESINTLVQNGVPFREAYIQVGNEVLEKRYTRHSHLQHTHMGSLGNLCNAEIKESMEKVLEKLN